MKILIVIALTFCTLTFGEALKVEDCFTYPREAFKAGDPMASAVWKIIGMVEEQYQVRNKKGDEKWSMPQLIPPTSLQGALKVRCP